MNEELIQLNACDCKGKVPEEIQLLPATKNVVGRDGRKWANPNPESLVEAFKANKADLPIDINHSTNLKGDFGEDSPAMGWITDVFIKPTKGIWASVEWTDQGKELVEAQSYRYISPTFLATREEGVIVSFTSAALTNQPNLKLTALNSQQLVEHQPTPTPTPNHNNKGDIMDKIIKALDLEKCASESDIITAINQMKSDQEQATKELDKARNSAKSAADKFVPTADYDAVVNARNTAIADLEAHQAQAHAEKQKAVLDKALKDGKISPASLEYHKNTTQTPEELARFEEQYLPNAPTLAPNSGIPNADPSVNTTLTTEQEYAANALGMTHEEYLTSLNSSTTTKEK